MAVTRNVLSRKRAACPIVIPTCHHQSPRPCRGASNATPRHPYRPVAILCNPLSPSPLTLKITISFSPSWRYAAAQTSYPAQPTPLPAYVAAPRSTAVSSRHHLLFGTPATQASASTPALSPRFLICPLLVSIQSRDLRIAEPSVEHVFRCNHAFRSSRVFALSNLHVRTNKPCQPRSQL
jgi:hypothetical protein